MYVLNDGRSLELHLKDGVLFSSQEERNATLQTIMDSRLPVLIALNGNRDMAPQEVRFLRNVVDTVRSIGGEVRFQSRKAS